MTTRRSAASPRSARPGRAAVRAYWWGRGGCARWRTPRWTTASCAGPAVRRAGAVGPISVRRAGSPRSSTTGTARRAERAAGGARRRRVGRLLDQVAAGPGISRRSWTARCRGSWSAAAARGRRTCCRRSAIWSRTATARPGSSLPARRGALLPGGVAAGRRPVRPAAVAGQGRARDPRGAGEPHRTAGRTSPPRRTGRRGSCRTSAGFRPAGAPSIPAAPGVPAEAFALLAANASAQARGVAGGGAVAGTAARRGPAGRAVPAGGRAAGRRARLPAGGGGLDAPAVASRARGAGFAVDTAESRVGGRAGRARRRHRRGAGVRPQPVHGRGGAGPAGPPGPVAPVPARGRRVVARGPAGIRPGAAAGLKNAGIPGIRRGISLSPDP